MFRSLSVLLFNTAEIERNLFGMADDLYNTIEIFQEASKFEENVARPYEMVSGIVDCVVFMAVALMVVAFTMHTRISKFRTLATQRYKQGHKKAKVARGQDKYASFPLNTRLPNRYNENLEDPAERNGFESTSGLATEDEDTITLQADGEDTLMLVTPKWIPKLAFYKLKIKGFGSIYDGLFR